MEIKNIKYFHTCANQRKKKNTIKCIIKKSNQIYEKEDDIKEAFRFYFSNIFESTDPEEVDIVKSTIASELRVMEEMNNKLCIDYSWQEVEEALS